MLYGPTLQESAFWDYHHYRLFWLMIPKEWKPGNFEMQDVLGKSSTFVYVMQIPQILSCYSFRFYRMIPMRYVHCDCRHGWENSRKATLVFPSTCNSPKPSGFQLPKTYGTFVCFFWGGWLFPWLWNCLANFRSCRWSMRRFASRWIFELFFFFLWGG